MNFHNKLYIPTPVKDISFRLINGDRVISGFSRFNVRGSAEKIDLREVNFNTYDLLKKESMGVISWRITSKSYENNDLIEALSETEKEEFKNKPLASMMFQKKSGLLDLFIYALPDLFEDLWSLLPKFACSEHHNFRFEWHGFPFGDTRFKNHTSEEFSSSSLGLICGWTDNFNVNSDLNEQDTAVEIERSFLS